MAKILVVDDEEDILEFLSYSLKKEGYYAGNPAKFLKKLNS